MILLPLEVNSNNVRKSKAIKQILEGCYPIMSKVTLFY